MGLLESIMGQLGGGGQITELAGKLGLSESQVQMAMAALGKAHAEPGDTVADASAATGIAPDALQNLIGQIGGENALTNISKMIDRDGDGNPVNDLMGIASKLFSR